MSIAGLLNHWPLEALLAIVAGLVILLVPRVLNYAVALYLLLTGLLGLAHGWPGPAIRPQALAALAAGILVLIKPQILNYVVGGYLILLGLLESGLLRW